MHLRSGDEPEILDGNGSISANQANENNGPSCIANEFEVEQNDVTKKLTGVNPPWYIARLKIPTRHLFRVIVMEVNAGNSPKQQQIWGSIFNKNKG